MELQFVLGASGAGKSFKIYKEIIEQATLHPELNYIVLVPEQYSMAIQKKMVELSPTGGYMNIDVIGFNRLAYRLFDEQNEKPGTVLEDFGKSMLLMRAARSVSEDLSVFSGMLDKPGFIDEAKSLMSELYQYELDRTKLSNAIDELEKGGRNSLLAKKLSDMKRIYEAFDREIEGSYIVAEQLTELLAAMIERSELIARSVIVMDSFTGFTPLQLSAVRALIKRAGKVYSLLTIDERAYKKGVLKPHDLFYLTSETVRQLKKIAQEEQIPVARDIFVERNFSARFSSESPIAHLERNLFRYPYEAYEKSQNAITVTVCESPVREISLCGEEILRLVEEEGYRYKDIAVVCGDLPERIPYLEQCFAGKIPYFADATVPIKNNACIDALGHILRICEENFSYDSVFAFLKSGVFDALSMDEIDQAENYVLAKGIRGKTRYVRSWNEEYEETRESFMDFMLPVYQKIGGTKKHKVSEYADTLLSCLEQLNAGEKLSGLPGVYERLLELFDKLSSLMAEQEMRVDEFHELLSVGLSELSLGRIPGTLDVVIVGDITRTRLDEIKVLFVLGVNDGVIPNYGSSPGIITDHEKERLKEAGFVMAPTDTENAYTEQFYLYQNLTKPSERLYLTYAANSAEGEGLRPSYVINRVQSMFPKLNLKTAEEMVEICRLPSDSLERLSRGIRDLSQGGDPQAHEETLAALKLILEKGDSETKRMLFEAGSYQNIPERLAEDVKKLIELRQARQSVSRLERFSACAYSYYLQYTIGLSERKTDGYDNREIGNILHGTMERLYRHVHDNLKNDWTGISKEQLDTLVTGFADESFDHEFEGHEEDGKYAYLRSAIRRIARRTAGSLMRISVKDGFSPEYFEYKFLMSIPYGTEGDKVNIRGIVDRADILTDDAGEKLLLRVIDYKSGERKFELSDVYEGLSLQLAVYLDVMKSLADADINKGKTEDEEGYVKIVPDGMYYYHMYDPFVDAEDLAKAEKEREKKLSLKGLENKDAEYFNTVVKYATEKSGELAGRIAAGEIDKNPIANGDNTPCKLCAYKNVCRFDERFGGNKMRFRKFKTTDREAIYKAMRERLKTDDEMDGSTTAGDR